MEVIVLTLKQCAIAFLGSKITKAMNEKEISEILTASFWTMLGINMVLPTLEFLNKIAHFIAVVAGAVEKVSNIIPFGG